MPETARDAAGLPKQGIYQPFPHNLTKHVLLVTVPHTATQATVAALKPYYEDIQALPNKVPNPVLIYKTYVRQLAWCHFRHETEKIILTKKPWEKFTLLRDPMLTMISQAARKDFNKQRMRPEKILEAWKLLIEHLHRFTIIKPETLGCDIPFVSTTQRYECHEAYKNNDLQYVRKRLGLGWDMIKSIENDIKPILDQNGFGRLPWYEL